MTSDEDDVEQPIEPQRVDGKWTANTSPVNVSSFDEFVGPKHDLPVGTEPLEDFYLLVPESFFSQRSGTKRTSMQNRDREELKCSMQDGSQFLR